jgi:hypothetical protein
MGFAISWCAVREDDADRFLQDLGLTPTGDTEELPESLIATGRLDTGWRVVWYNGYTCPFLEPQNLAKLSMIRDVVLCLVEEHVMASSAELWTGGKRKWRVSHEGEDGPKGLSVEGHAPEALRSIQKEMEELQIAEGGEDADVDYIFEIPLKVAKSIVGFKHDEDSRHLIGGVFQVMSHGPPPKAGFLSRLLRR